MITKAWLPLLLLSASAFGQQAAYRSWNCVGAGSTNFGTNVIVAGAANLTASGMARYVTNSFFAEAGPLLDVRVDLTLRTAGAAAIPITLQKSYDNKNWETFTSFSVTPNGTTAVTFSTNDIVLGNYGYVRVSQINNTGNGATAGITNLSIRFSAKDPPVWATILPGGGGGGGGVPEITNGIVLWFKSETITNTVDNSRMDFWIDSSPTATNANSIQGAGFRPYYRTAVLNGLPAIATSNAPADLELRYTAPNFSNSFTVVWVGKLWSADNYNGLFACRSVGQFGFGLTAENGTGYRPHLTVVSAAGAEIVNTAAVGIVPTPTATAVQIMWTYSPTSTNCWTNGVVATIGPGDLGYSIAYGSIGRAYQVATAFHGEMQVYPYVLNSTKLTDLYTRLKAKWGTP